VDGACSENGIVTWDGFLKATESFIQMSGNLGEEWKREGPPNVPGARYMSYSCFKESKNEEMGTNLLKCEYHVVYSMSYSVPVVYFNVFLTSGKLLSLEQVCSVLESDELSGKSNKNIRSIISQQEHPILHLPYFFLHPCHTEATMKSVLSARRGSISNLGYFLSWLSLVARVVGIPLSNEYGKLMLALRSVAAPITDMLGLD
jgi:ubiquitin-like-conjugating enzyme ATG10